MSRVRPAKDPPVPKELLRRMTVELEKRRRKYEKASEWTGEYGYGKGKAHPSVEFATCPCCHSPPKHLCIGDRGPKFSIHFRRGREYARMKRLAAEQILDRHLRGKRGAV